MVANYNEELVDVGIFRRKEIFFIYKFFYVSYRTFFSSTYLGYISSGICGADERAVLGRLRPCGKPGKRNDNDDIEAGSNVAVLEEDDVVVDIDDDEFDDVEDNNDDDKEEFRLSFTKTISPS